jgi:P27 family predicted phage terminase small subunit
MAKRGPKPKALRLRVLSGQIPGATNRGIPSDGKLPTCPPWLDREAKRGWEELVPVLAGMGVLHAVDRHALMIYCQAYSRWRAAVAALAPGLTVKTTEADSIKSHPALRVVEAAERIMMSILGEFGCTPVARARLTVNETRQDPLGEFLSRRKPPKDHVYTKGNANE